MSFPLSRIVDSLRKAGLIDSIDGDLPTTAPAITDDSRRVGPGDVFIAVKGSTSDGHGFIGAAVEKGAACVILERRATGGVPAIVVNDGRRAAALAAAAAQDFPARGLTLLGVTGTNGKTTTAGILRHLFDEPVSRSASIGTVGIMFGSEGVPVPGGADLTTPGAVELQGVLATLSRMGVKTVAMEVSSHSLDQRRVEGIEFRAALFTNLTRDHLDYHHSMEAYFAAKAQLLNLLGSDGIAVINADAAWDRLQPPGDSLTYGTRKRADIRGENIVHTRTGSEWDLVAGEHRAFVSLPLFGDFNVHNALAAAAAAIALGYDPAVVADRLAKVPQVPGRLEKLSDEPTIIRDYAHTPDALERALRVVRPVHGGRLVVVFGCGGDRDPGKRPIMGRIAETGADIVILTSDNPRTEDPEKIMDEIEGGMAGRSHHRVEDRRAAITKAVEVAERGDVILLAGKGHETYQVRGTERLPFDEREIVAQLVAAAPG